MNLPPSLSSVVWRFSQTGLLSIVPSKTSVPCHTSVGPVCFSMTLGSTSTPSPCLTSRVAPLKAPPVNVVVKVSTVCAGCFGVEATACRSPEPFTQAGALTVNI